MVPQWKGEVGGETGSWLGWTGHGVGGRVTASWRGWTGDWMEWVDGYGVGGRMDGSWRGWTDDRKLALVAG